MDEHDEVLSAIVSRLRPLPEVNPEAKARVLIAVAAERERDRVMLIQRRQWQRRARWAGSGVLAAAALIGALYLRPREESVSPQLASAPAPTSAPAGVATMASEDPAVSEMAAQPVQFVFRAPDAHSVRVVGDFNTWDSKAAPMVRDAASGLWSITLMIKPGRHVYAFVVNDSVWARDPRAEVAPDADFGRPGSVLFVNRAAAQAVR